MSVLLGSCGPVSYLSFDDSQAATVTYYEYGTDGKKALFSKSVKPDIMTRLNAIKFCSTGVTTVTEWFKFEYVDGNSQEFGFANFGSIDQPNHHVSYKFSPDDLGQDLRYPCSKNGHVEFEKLILFLKDKEL